MDIGRFLHGQNSIHRSRAERYTSSRNETGSRCRKMTGRLNWVVPGEKGNARWVRQLSALRVEPNATPYGSEQARWIQENLPELKSIKVGMTRGELLKVFMEEGGISTRTWQRYVYRKCGYVKVDVEFASASEKDDTPHGRPDDRITKISKPYLELATVN
jgi:hypothetical protein